MPETTGHFFINRKANFRSRFVKLRWYHGIMQFCRFIQALLTFSASVGTHIKELISIFDVATMKIIYFWRCFRTYPMDILVVWHVSSMSQSIISPMYDDHKNKCTYLRQKINLLWCRMWPHIQYIHTENDAYIPFTFFTKPNCVYFKKMLELGYQHRYSCNPFHLITACFRFRNQSY